MFPTQLSGLGAIYLFLISKTSMAAKKTSGGQRKRKRIIRKSASECHFYMILARRCLRTTTLELFPSPENVQRLKDVYMILARRCLRTTTLRLFPSQRTSKSLRMLWALYEYNWLKIWRCTTNHCSYKDWW